MIAAYKLTNKSLDGHIEIEFFKGYLKAVKIELKENFNGPQFTKFFSNIPRFEDDIYIYEELGLRVNKIDLYARMTAPQKIALFCQFYKEFKNQPYKASRIDGVRIKEYKITPDILQAYFTSNLFEIKGPEGSPGKHSIRNLMDYYNQLLVEMDTVQKEKPKFPDHWSKEIEAKLNVNDLPDYWKHLRGLGFRAIKNNVGVVTEWTKI